MAYDPKAVFLDYQQKWIRDRSPVKVCIKSRQIGITWSTAYEFTEVSSTSKAEGGRNTWYQCNSGEDAQEFIDDVCTFARVLDRAVELEDSDESVFSADKDKSILRKSVRFGSGLKTTTLPGNPRKWRGKRGIGCVDEANYNEDLEGSVKALSAFRVWGGRFMLISTVGDEGEYFDTIVRDIEDGRPEKREWSLHRITLLDAVKDGLFRRICQKAKREWSSKLEEDWVNELLLTPGAEQEFLCIPRKRGSQYISDSLIESAQREDYRVIRFEKTKEWGNLHPSVRAIEFDSELREVRLDALSRGCIQYVGYDFARNMHLSYITIGDYDSRTDSVAVKLAIEIENMPNDQQQQLVLWLAEKLPRFGGIALDSLGNGQALAEFAVGRLGEEKAAAVNMNDEFYGYSGPKLKLRFEQRKLTIPWNDELKSDIGKIVYINGIPKIPKQTEQTGRHADGAASLLLLEKAVSTFVPLAHSGYESIDRKVKVANTLWKSDGLKVWK